MKPRLPFRLGSTSYVYPADILPNARKLAAVVDDIELVLFEVDATSNLPTPAVVSCLSDLAIEHGVTYTVHLPLDLRLAAENASQRHPSIDKAQRVIDAMRPLEPWAYVVHLDGSELVAGEDPGGLIAWREQAAGSLELIAHEAGEPGLLAIENLEEYEAEAFLPLVDELGVRLCVDVGHFVKVGRDVMAYLRANVARTRVVHLHGCEDGRDHRGIDALPTGLIAEVLDTLLLGGFAGVATLEVFTERDFYGGRDIILSLLEDRRCPGP